MKINVVDYSVWLEAFQTGTEIYKDGGWDAGFDMAWGGSNDPDQTIMLHTDNAPPAGYNKARWSNGKVDQLLEDGLSKMTREERKPIYNNLHDIFVEEMPVIPVAAEAGYYVFNEDITGVENIKAWQYGSSDWTPLWATWLGSKSGEKTFVNSNYYRIKGLLPQNDWIEVPSCTFGWLLQRYPPDMGLQPCLAKSWEVSDDSLTFTYFLRDDILWSDGEPFTSADVKFTFDALSDPNFITTASRWMKYVSSVKLQTTIHL
jgi:ABC-type transport system substrate-binding protein